MVTHEPEDEKYVDRVIWLKDGFVWETSPQYDKISLIQESANILS